MMLKLISSPMGLLRGLYKFKYAFGLPAFRYMAYQVLIDKIVRRINPDIINAHGNDVCPGFG